jgi:membrane protease YdiL (CAAX protease family)
VFPEQTTAAVSPFRQRLARALSGALNLLLFGAMFVVFSTAGAFLLLSLQGVVNGPGAEALAMFGNAAATLVSALLAGWMLMRLREHRPLGALGFAWTDRTLPELGWGMLIGAGGLALGVLVLAMLGRAEFAPDAGSFPSYARSLTVGLILFGIAAAAEEALFRGYPFQVLVRGIGMWPATLLASAGFAYAHKFNPGIGSIALANIFLAGVLLSLAYLRTRSLWFATAVHLGWNWTMASVLDLPVSGLRIFDTPYYDAHLERPYWLTGGPFGPEGGAMATLTFVVMLAAVLKLPAVREAPEMRALRPIIDDSMERVIPHE